MKCSKIRNITNLDIQYIVDSIQKQGLYEVYYLIKGKQELTRQDRLLMGYLDSTYLRNHDIYDRITIPMIQKILNIVLDETPLQIKNGVNQLEQQYKEEEKKTKRN